MGEPKVGGPRAGGDEYVICLKRGCLAVPGDREPALGDDLPLALDDGDLVLLHQSFDARIELPGDLARAVDHLGQIERRLFDRQAIRSEEHTSELQSLMRISYAVFCLKKKK